MMGHPIQVLIVEDSQVDTELVLQELRDGGFEPEYQRVDNPLDFTVALENNAWDLIISDYVMPHFSEPAAMEILKQSKRDIPFIVISGKIGEETAVKAMKSGAHDYVMKDNLARLVPAINRELQEAHERAGRRQAEQELENFIASLTHDLRTPLAAELRILELVMEGYFGNLTSQLDEVVQEMVRSNHFMQHMVNNILYAYKYKKDNVQLEIEAVDIVAFISSYASSMLVNFMMSAKNQTLLLEMDETRPLVNIDILEIQRVLNNLLKNATDHSPQNATIELIIRTAGNFVRIGVQDHGLGLDPGIEPHLFKPYSTNSARKYHQVGLGLGLYLSKRIIDAHAGRIGYSSTPGEGCLFYFELPLAVEEGPQAEAVVSGDSFAIQESCCNSRFLH